MPCLIYNFFLQFSFFLVNKLKRIILFFYNIFIIFLLILHKTQLFNVNAYFFYIFLSTKKTESEITLTPAFLFITFMYLSSSGKNTPIFMAGRGYHSPMRLSISFNRNNFCPVSNGSVRFSLYCFIFSIVVP